MVKLSQEDFKYYYKKPGELTAGCLDKICILVESGGSVNFRWIRFNLENAFLIGYVLYQKKLIACSVLKNPRPEYLKAVKEQAGLNLSSFLERGYTSVLPEFRGRSIGSNLLSSLTSRVGERKLYSVIGETNIGGQKIALNNNTKRVAVYKSKITGKKTGIWIPEWMIDQSKVFV